MSNGVTVTVSIELKPKHVDSFFNEMLPQLQKRTIVFPGVRAARAVRQEAQPNKVLFIDIFETVVAVDAYFRWREERGDLEMLSELLSSPPRIEVWPLSSEAT